MTTETTLESIALAALPAIQSELAGGTYAGAITLPDGTLVAVVADLNRTTGLTWQKAMALAQDKGATLPTKAVAALITSNLKGPIKRGWYWTCEADEGDDQYAWDFNSYGSCLITRKDNEGSALLVRLIPIKP